MSPNEWLRGDFQNVARWEPGHRLEAYATLACRRGCRWSADLPAGAFETSFHTPESQCSIGFQPVLGSQRPFPGENHPTFLAWRITRIRPKPFGSTPLFRGSGTL